MTRAPSAVRVLGVGSPAGDDRAGWLVADALARGQAPAGCTLQIESMDRPGPALALALGGADLVVIIDAAEPAGQPGRVAVHDLDHFTTPQDHALGGAALSSHALGVGAALALAVALGKRPANAVVVTIEACSTGPGAPLSEAVASAVPRATASVVALIETFCERATARR